MTIVPVQASEDNASTITPEKVAVARLASLRAMGTVATARPWERWLFDGGTSPAQKQPWLIVTPDDLTIEIVFDPDMSLARVRRVLMRLLADRWNLVVRVHPTVVPEAITTLGDLPLRVDRWDRI